MAPRIDKLLFPQRLQATFTHPDPDVVAAYMLCSTVEYAMDPISESDHWPLQGKTARLKLIFVRVLGHLLSQSELLSDTSISAVARAILRCRNEGAEEVNEARLDKLGEFYKDYFICPRKCLALTDIVLSDGVQSSS